MPLILGLLQILITMGVGPAWLVTLLPLLIDFGPAAELLIVNLIKFIQELEKQHNVVFVGSVPSMIPAYDGSGALTMIPNPDYPVALAVHQAAGLKPTTERPSTKALEVVNAPLSYAKVAK
jgi:hypothetical protein